MQYIFLDGGALPLVILWEHLAFLLEDSSILSSGVVLIFTS